VTVNVTVNGSPCELPEDATVASVVAALTGAANGRGVAVALQGEVVPRGAWSQTTLPDGAEIEVVHAVQGG
jgi:sulfur carrier protein